MRDHPTGGFRLRRTFVVLALASAALATALPAHAANALTIHQIIAKYTLAAGFHADDVAAMKRISDYESHDNPKTHSRTCWGLFQLSTSMVAGHPWADPVWNTKRAVRYVKSRYGNPIKAWAHIKKTGWY